MHVQVTRPEPAGLHAGAPRTRVLGLPEIVTLAAEEMSGAEVRLRELTRSTVPAVETIGQYLVEAGGKRLRPLLTALAARAVGVEGDLSDLMCVGELVHLGSLLHDDVVDEGMERRGQPTAHRVHGNAGVILTGDVCLARSVVLAASAGGLRAVHELGCTITDMSEGEVIQLQQKGSFDMPLETYLEVIDKKSAALIAWCAAAGAWKLGKEAEAEALVAFGRAVGSAFQISDDVLDYVGDKRKTGKRRGQDLAEGKPTLPLILAMERVPDLAERLRGGAPSPERIPALLAEVQASGAIEAAQAEARRRVAAALEALEILEDSPHKAALQSLAHHLVDRVA